MLLLLHGHLVYGATSRTESKGVIGATTVFSIGSANAAKLVPTTGSIRVTHVACGRHHMMPADHKMPTMVAAMVSTGALEVTAVLSVVRLDRV